MIVFNFTSSVSGVRRFSRGQHLVDAGRPELTTSGTKKQEGHINQLIQLTCRHGPHLNENQLRVQRYGEYSITRTILQLKTCKRSEQLPIAAVTLRGLAYQSISLLSHWPRKMTVGANF